MKKLLNKIYKSIENCIVTDCEVDVGIEYFYKGMQCYDEKEYERAIKFYKQALKYEPNSDATYFNIGNVFYIQKVYDEALVYYKQALLLNAKSPNAHYQIGLIYHIQQKYKKALEFYIEAEKSSKMSEDSYENLAICYMQVKNNIKAIEYYEKVLQLNPTHKYTLQDMGYLYSQMGNQDESIKYYKRLVLIEPNEELFNLLAFFHLEKQEYKNGIQYLLNSMKYNTKNVDTLHNLSFSFFQLKDFEKSIEYSRKLIEVEEDRDAPYLNIFESQLLLGVPFSEELEIIFIEKFKNLKSIFMIYEFLMILKHIVEKREFVLNEWDKKYENNSFLDWDFTMLGDWAEKYEDDEVKTLLLKALEFFNQRIKK